MGTYLRMSEFSVNLQFISLIKLPKTCAYFGIFQSVLRNYFDLATLSCFVAW